MIQMTQRHRNKKTFKNSFFSIAPFQLAAVIIQCKKTNCNANLTTLNTKNTIKFEVLGRSGCVSSSSGLEFIKKRIKIFERNDKLNLFTYSKIIKTCINIVCN